MTGRERNKVSVEKEGWKKDTMSGYLQLSVLGRQTRGGIAL